MSWLELEVLDSAPKAAGKKESGTASERDADMEAQTRPSLSDNETEVGDDEEKAPLI